MYNKSKNCELLLNNNVDKPVTRSSTKLKFEVEFTSLTRVQNSPLYRGVALWDTLPDHIQKARSKYEFKRAIKMLPT